MDSPSSHKMISHHIQGMTVLYSYKHCVLGLIIVSTLIYRLTGLCVQRHCLHCIYLFDVFVESQLCTVIVELLLHKD